jgi:hypothetical protein
LYAKYQEKMMQARKKKKKQNTLTFNRDRMRLSLKHFLGEGLIVGQEKTSPSSHILFKGALNEQLLIGLGR